MAALLHGMRFSVHREVIDRGVASAGAAAMLASSALWVPLAFAAALALIEGTSYHGRALVAELSAPPHLHGEPKRTAISFDAAVAMIEVAISVFATLPWEGSAFH